MARNKLADQNADDWRWMLSDPRGQRIAARLMQAFGIFAPCDTPIEEGRRRCALIVHAAVLSTRQDTAIMAVMAEIVRPPDVGNERRTSD